MLSPINIKVFYDNEVKKITNKDSENMIVSENINFSMLLNFIFCSYPEMQSAFPPGTLGFLLNKKIPMVFDVIHNNDELEISGWVKKNYGYNK